jgi:hypothetical protein
MGKPRVGCMGEVPAVNVLGFESFLLGRALTSKAITAFESKLWPRVVLILVNLKQISA